MTNLDDLRYFLALARHDSLVKAAGSLEVSRMTVSRRIASIEKEMGVRLFDKTPGGWTMTRSGASIFEQAERIESIAKDLFQAEGEKTQISGTVRIITTDGFGYDVLPPWTAHIYAALPKVRTEILTSSRLSPFTSKDFDIAITVHRPNMTKVRTRKLTDYSLGLYATPEYLGRFGIPDSLDELKNHRFVWFVESLNDLPELQFLRPTVPAANVVAEYSTVTGQQAAAAAGIGIGFLPRFSADADSRLVRVLDNEVKVRRTFHLIVRETSLRLRHVQAVIDILLELAAQERDRFEGTEKGHP